MASQKDQYVTKNMLNEAVDSILQGMDRLFNDLRGEMKAGFSQVEKRFDKVESDVTFIKRDVNDIKEDISDTPTLGQLNKIKERVSQLEKAN